MTPSVTVTATRLGAKLGFADFVGTIPGGEYAGNEISDAHIFLQQPIVVDVEPNGAFTIPAFAGSFYITAIVAGDRYAFTSTNVTPITGFYDEAAGLFTMNGAIRDPDDTVTGAMALTIEFANRPPVADAGPDQTVECDSVQGTALVLLSASGSSDPDGPDDLDGFLWGIDHGTTAQQAAEGENVVVTLGLGAHDVVLTVLDQAGSFGQDDALVGVEDTTPPSIAIQVPEPIEYVHSDTFHLLYDVEDGCTGVDAVTALLDGSTLLAGHGLASGQAIELLTELPLGDHTFRVEAVDLGGNPSAAEVTFSIIVTTESIKQDVAIFVEKGAIRVPGIPTSLLAKLNTAGAKHDAGDCGVAANVYRAFIQELLALRGGAVDAVAADIMIADAQYLIDHCP